MEDEIYSFKLTTGEEIISKLIGEHWNNDYLILDEPRTLMMGQNGNLSLAPVLFSADPTHHIFLSKSAIACWSKYIREELKTGYLSSVSKLVIPNKNIIMG